MNKTNAAIVRTLLLGTSCLSVFAVDAARAQPTGGSVALGSATISNQGANSTIIDQKTGKLVINWDSFNIAAGGTVQFKQPGSSSIALNRILGADPTAIYGNLLANGQVWIVNGNGVMFGQGSRINVGGLIATTSDLRDADFAAGNYSFSGGTGASVVNQGTIRAGRGGYAVLSGASASNRGLIAANTGTVVIGGASAFTVDFQGDGLLRYAVTTPGVAPASGPAGASNSGTITAGRVVMTARAAADVQGAVVNNTGMISASSARVQNGEVILDGGDGDVNVAGTVQATGTASGTTGGDVTVTGRNITVADNTTIDASGDAGGGTVRIGGDLHGAGPTPNAANVTVGNAAIKADATRKGNGGTVVVWSDGTTDFSGSVSAKGGAAGGNGGLVETSGHSLHVAPTVTIDTRAPKGLTGSWLLDPDSIDIQTDGDATLTSGVLPRDQAPGENDTIAPQTIINALATTDVTLEAEYDITVHDAVNYSSGHALSLLAGGDIYIAADVQNAGTGAINVIAGWDKTTVDPSLFTQSGVYANGEGGVFVTSDYDFDPEPGPDKIHSVAIGSAGGTTTIAGSVVGVFADYAPSQIGYLGAGGGDIVVRAKQDIDLDGSAGYNAVVGNGVFGGGTAGNVTGNIDIQVGDNFVLFGGPDSTAWVGNTAGTGFSEQGNVTIVSSGGFVNVDFGGMIATDLAGGDFTLGTTGGFFEPDTIQYDSPHNFTLLSTGDIVISSTISNAGSGAITLVAGWDGHTLNLDDLKQEGAFGLNDGEVTIGGEDAYGDVFIGSKSGALTVLTDYLDVDAEWGNAQLGYRGAGGGDISVTAVHDVNLFGGDPSGGFAATIGNGALDNSVSGSVGGNIFLSIGGTLTLATWNGGECECEGDAGNSSTVFIGNSTATGSGGVSGNLVVLTAGVDDIDDSNGGIGRIITADLANGDVTLGETDSEVTATFYDDLSYGSEHNLTLLATGGLDIQAGIENSGSGAITLVAGWDGIYDPNTIGATGTFGFNGGTITIGGGEGGHYSGVGTAQGDLKVYGANLTLNAGSGVAQLGYDGVGGGNIFATMTGDIIAYGGSSFENYALIGNGGPSGEGDVTGNISLKAGGNTLFLDGFDSEDEVTGGVAWLGNVAGEGYNETGDVTAVTRDGFFGANFLAADLGTAPGTGGNVFIGFTDPTVGTLTIGGLDYNSANSFTFAGAGSVNVVADIKNSGTGAVTLVAGWDGETIGSAADLKAAGAYGLNGAVLTVGAQSPYFEDVSVGSAGGLTTILSHDVTIAPSDGYYAQIGYHGTGGGEIDVFASGNLTLHAGSGATGYAMIGNGSRNGDVTGDVGGKIDVEVRSGTTEFLDGEDGARAWLGNATGGTGKASGDVAVVTDFGFVPSDILIADLGTSADTGGDVFFGYSDPDDGRVSFGGMSYNSPHNFTIASPTDLLINGSIQNAGTGEVVMVAGWDEQTFGDAAALLAANAYGLHGAVLTIDGDDVAAGSAGGLTAALSHDIVLSGGSGYAQLGWHGTGGGDIQVVATGDLTLTGGSASTQYALIGNGSLNGDVSGTATGNIDVQVAGTTSFVPGNGLQNVWIGNFASGANTGNVTIVTGDLGNQGPLDAMLSHDLVGGDVTLAVTDSGAATVLSGQYLYSSAHTFNLLGTGDLTITGAVQNSGSGAINAVAGWDGSTFDAAHFTDDGVYGNHGGTLTIGGSGAAGTAALGSAGGTTTALGYDLDVNAANGFAQLGYAGNGGGDIVALAAHDISVTTSGSLVFALIGNGGYGAATTSSTGDIAVTAGHSVFVTAAGANTAAKIGNGQLNALGTVDGDITVTALAGDVVLSTGADTTRAQIGNGFGTQSDVGGSITVSGNTVSLATGASNSSAMIGGSGSARITSDILVDATDVSLLSSWDSSSTQIGNGGSTFVDGPIAGSVLFGGDITVNAGNSLSLTTAHANAGAWIGNGGDGSAMGLTVSGALAYSGDIAVNVGTTGHAGTLTMSEGGSSDVYIGNGGYQSGAGSTATGGISQTGDIAVTVLGGATHGASMAVTNSGTGVARIGNGVGAAADAVVGGDIAITVDGGLQFVSNGPNLAYAGNSASGSGGESGDLTIVAQSLTGVEASLSSVLGGGDALIEILGTGPFTIGAPVSYTGGHTLDILAKGNIVFASSVQNAGSGAIDLVAGWDGHTLEAAHFGDAGVYGNGGGAVTVGGASAGGNVAVGSHGGALNVYTGGLTLSGINGYAQLGYHGSGGGPVNVHALGAVALNGGANPAQFAQIGSGSVFEANTTSGDATVSAASVGSTGVAAVVADDLSLTATAGGIGNSNTPLQVAVNSLTLQTSGGSAYLTTPQSISLAGAALSGGNLTLAAGGAITQSGAIFVGALDVSTTSGAIALADTGNVFTGLTVATQGGDNAAVTNSARLSVASANVGGTLTLVAGTGIGQGGAIHAAGLNATANNGTVVLTNAGNAFSTLAVSTAGSHDATVTDSTAVTLAASTVGGKLTLSAGGAVAQSGALHSASLAVSTTAGGIALTQAGNAVAGTATFSAPGAVSFTDTVSISLGATTSGGLLTLVSGGGIGQSGAIHAGGVSATANGGDIVLNNTGNAFATLSLSASGAAGVTDSTAVTIAGATVGGALTLIDSLGITQSGAIHAASLNATADAGDIVLTNTGNAFATLSLSAGGAASVTDSAAVTIAGATVGGALTLVDAVGIAQSGAIQAASLNATAQGGGIVLTNSGNSFAALTLSTASGGNATVTDSTGVTLGASSVGGVLTLSAGGAVAQSGALQSGGLSVTTTSGDIVLTDAANAVSGISAFHTPGAARFTDSLSATVGASSVGGLFTLVSGGGIGQSGAIHAGGLSAAANGGGIVLTDSGNSFATLVVSTGANATVTDSTGVTLGASGVGGKLTLAAGGTIAQSGALHSAGLAASTTAGDIVLANVGNAVSGTVTFATPGAARFTDTLSFDVGASSVGGLLTLVSGGGITQSGAIQAAGLDATANDGSIALTNIGNSFAALTLSATGDATVTDSTGVTLGASTVGGKLTLVAGGAVGQSGALHSAGLGVTTTAGNIVLTDAGNAVTGTVSFNTPGAASFTDTSSFGLGATTVGGLLTLVSGGGITQSGAIQAGGLDAAANGGAIVLTDTGNSFATLVLSTAGGNDASVTDSTAVSIGGANVSGALTLLAGGAITQTGAITSGALNVSTTSGAITLTDIGNAFGGLTVSTTGSDNASFAHASLLTVASANVGGTLTLTAGTAIAQTGAIHAAGLNATAKNGTIVLTDAGNAFATLALSTTGGNDATVTDSTGVTLAASTVGGRLTLAAGGAIGQSGALHSAGLAVSTTSGDIALDNAGNAVAGTVTFHTPGAARFTDTQAIGVGASSVGGLLTLVSAGGISQSGAIQAGGLSATANGGDIVLNDAGNAFATLGLSASGKASVTDSAAVTISGANVGGALTLVDAASIAQSGAIHAASLNATVNGGGIVLTNSGNSFAVLTLSTAAGQDATVVDSTGVTFGASTVGGKLTLTAGGAVGQSGAIQAGGLSVTTSAGDIVLANAGNSVSGTASFHTPGAASFTDLSSLTVGASSVGGLLTLVSGGGISQTGAILAGGLDATANGGSIVLTNSGNAFGTLVVSTGSDATVTDSTGVTLGASSVGGTLTLSVGGAVAQSGALQSGGLSVTTSAGDIVLTNAGNSVSGAASFSTPGAASFTDLPSLAVGASSVGGLLTLVSGGGISQSGAILAGGLNATANGGAIVLNNAGNAFATLVLSTGSDATATDSTGVTLGASSVGGTLTLSAGGAVGQSGALRTGGLSVATSSGNIVLTNAANAVSGTAAFHTPGAANFTDTTSVNVGTTSVGGLLTLVSGGGITQSGAVLAGGLSATAKDGSIVLTNSGNSFAALTLSSTGASTIVDSTGVTLGASSVGGKLTLTAGGAVGQSGALQSAGLAVTTTSGDIVLTDAANAVSGAVAFATPGAASFTDTTSVDVGATTVGGSLALVSGGGITQSGAILAGGLSATAKDGAIVLTNSGNAFGTLAVSTGSDATVTDATGVTLGASNVGGTLALTAGGAVAQSGALHSAGLNVSTTSGGIALTDLANAVSGIVQFSTPGAASFTDTLDLSVGGASVGGDLTLLSKGNVGFRRSVQSDSGAIVVVAGWDGVTTNAAQFGNSGVYGNGNGSVFIGGTGAAGDVDVGSKSGATTIYASNVNVLGANGGAQLGYHGAGGGAIRIVALHDLNVTAGAGSALVGNGSAGDDVAGNVTGDIDVRLGGDVVFTDAGNAIAWLGNVAHAGSETGNLVLVANGIDGSDDGRIGDIVTAAIVGGDVTLGLTGTEDLGPSTNYGYNSSHTFNLLAAGNVVFAGSIQNAGSGAINVVAGWDGHTLAPASFGQSGAFGNNGKGVIIGGALAGGGVAVGSASGTVSVYGASLALSAINGYAQLGFNGHGSGAIAVTTTGAVTLTGGGAGGAFAQIGNGGLKTSGSNSGDILIVAGGDIVLAAGAGGEAYVQIGHGGAESNTDASGYSNTGAIGLTAANLTVTAGTGAAAYAQIGQGGFKSGLGLAGGQAINSGNVSVTVAHQVSLTGKGVDAYAQIGNGGSQSNLNAAAAAGGTDSGVIVVSAPNGPGGAVTLTAGAGPNAYAQIGNGGYAVNSGPNATAANFTVTGDIAVTDLALTGSGDNGFAQIGNGDASRNSYGNVSGNIVIDANGLITYTQGTGIHSPATIGNFTGTGTAGGSIAGASPPSEITNDPSTIGVVVTTTANNRPNGDNPITTINTVVITEQDPNGGSAALVAHLEPTPPPPPGPLASLDDKNAESGANASDGATVVIADSLDGAKRAGATQSILAGMLSQMNPAGAGRTVHGIPPADQDFSSWGNEALWQ
ncbi:MAG: filamentous hemagglutinin N-terminal domain-containing protein [Rhizomicrobium sp.]